MTHEQLEDLVEEALVPYASLPLSELAWMRAVLLEDALERSPKPPRAAES